MCVLVLANQMYNSCQSNTVASYPDSVQKLKGTSESKKYFFEIKTISRDVSAISVKTKIQ